MTSPYGAKGDHPQCVTAASEVAVTVSSIEVGRKKLTSPTVYEHTFQLPHDRFTELPTPYTVPGPLPPAVRPRARPVLGRKASMPPFSISSCWSRVSSLKGSLLGYRNATYRQLPSNVVPSRPRHPCCVFPAAYTMPLSPEREAGSSTDRLRGAGISL
jgi:hypothetical protein